MPANLARNALSKPREGLIARDVHRRRNAGFTLLELMIVVVLIVGSAALAAMVIGDRMPGQQLRGAAREVAAQLRYTRAQAIASGRPQVFTLDARTRQWLGPQRRHGELPPEIEIKATTARIEQRQADSASVRFFPQGSSTGGRFVLYRERAAWQVDIDWLTGQVNLSRTEPPR
ncbi:GspH/FimT family pseudopilin [Arenimonas sp.]|uniref:GspH/FimT family pseudopilin n=1 Tax=Arenimonas sp. TaxID=1872635 RepID=UPI0039E657E4